MTRRLLTAAGAGLLTLCAAAPLSPIAPAAAEEAGHRPAAARSARPQRGTASYYAAHFEGRRMANGRRFDPHARSAAHRTLPLGATARVTNLENGRSTVVTVEDRGPHVAGRLIDLSPRSAAELGMQEQGLALVQVTPLDMPLETAGPAGRHPAE